MLYWNLINLLQWFQSKWSKWWFLRTNMWKKYRVSSQSLFFFFFFICYEGFSFTDTDDSQNSRGREGTVFYSTLQLPSTHKHLDFYLQLCMWDPYHIFKIAPLVFCQTATRWDLPPYRINIWLIDDVMLIFVCLPIDLILGFCYSNFSRETTGLELASTITTVLQPNWLTKCTNHP